MKEIKNEIKSSTKSSPVTIEDEIRWFNESEDDRTDCVKCQGRGYFAFLEEGKMHLRECDCIKQERVRIYMKKSGLGDLIHRNRLDNFEVREPFQKRMMETVKKWLPSDGWLFVGGQVGSGKTHICTGALREKAKQGSIRYMLWRDEAVKMKGNVNEPFYEEKMRQYKTADVLYIDDFFKTGGAPTAGDINLAFEIINHRYNTSRQTIISSEKRLGEILDIDEAIGSRIGEKAKGFTVYVEGKNWRFEK